MEKDEEDESEDEDMSEEEESGGGGAKAPVLSAAQIKHPLGPVNRIRVS